MSITSVMKLDKNLKHLIKKKKISIADLSKEVAVPQSTLHGWINGTRPRDVVHLQKVAKYFKLNIHELCFCDYINVVSDYSEKIIGEFDGIELVLRRN